MNYITLAEQEVLRKYGDAVKASAKKKTTLKFGKNMDIDLNVPETIWTFGGDETYTDTNSIDMVASSNAADVGVEVSINGHTVEGTGANAKFTEVTQTVTLNGQNKVALSTPVARLARSYVSGSQPLAGNMHIFEDTALTAGVPTDKTKVHLDIQGSKGDQQSFKAALTMGDDEYGFLTGINISIGKRSASQVDYTFECRNPGSIFRPVTQFSIESNAQAVFYRPFEPYVIIPKNADVRMKAVSSVDNVEVWADFAIIMAGPAKTEWWKSRSAAGRSV